MASQVSIAGNVRNTTRTFAEALMSVGVRVKWVHRSRLIRGITIHSADAIRITGQEKFDAELIFDYEMNHVVVEIRTKRGVQMKAHVTSHSELQTLLYVWKIADYA